MTNYRGRGLTAPQEAVDRAQKALDHELFRCIDCGVNTSTIGEYYMVRDDVWAAAIGKPDSQAGMLCIGCLETRLGRRLGRLDFTHNLGEGSSRLKLRLRGM
jgi:hypothetical protein